MIEQEIPQNAEAEECLLSALIEGPSLCLEHAGLLTEDLFWIAANRTAFQAVAELAKKRDRIDWAMFLSEVSKLTALEDIGGKEFLNRLWGKAPASSWSYHYEDVFTAYRLRQNHLAALRILQCKDPHEQSAIADEALKAVSAPQKHQSIPFKERMQETLEWIEHTTREPSPSLLNFGIPLLDSQLYPVEGGNQIVIGGQTGSGKSALAAQAVLKSPGAAAIFSLEMDAKSLVVRIMASESGVALDRIRKGKIAKPEFDRLNEAYKLMESRPIWIEDVSPADVRSIAGKCRSLKHQGLSIAVIDYLQLVTPSTAKRDSSREREVAEISRSLKSLAMELNIVVVALSQLNDQGQVRESRAIAQDADTVLLIEHQETSKRDLNGESEIITRKQRNGALGRIPVVFDGRFMRFSEARDAQAAETHHKGAAD